VLKTLDWFEPSPRAFSFCSRFCLRLLNSDAIQVDFAGLDWGP
jgi:hypothetical protein